MRILALVALSLSGCSTVATCPTVTLRELVMLERTDQGASFEAVLQLHNPNRTPLPLALGQYTIVLGPTGDAFTWTVPLHRTIPGKSTQVVALPAAFRSAGQDLRAAPYTISGLIRYDPPGRVRKFLTESNVPLPQVSFHATGRLP